SARPCCVPVPSPPPEPASKVRPPHPRPPNPASRKSTTRLAFASSGGPMTPLQVSRRTTPKCKQEPKEAPVERPAPPGGGQGARSGRALSKIAEQRTNRRTRGHDENKTKR